MSRSVCADEFKTGARGINQTSFAACRIPTHTRALSVGLHGRLTFLHATCGVLLSGGIFFFATLLAHKAQHVIVVFLMRCESHTGNGVRDCISTD